MKRRKQQPLVTTETKPDTVIRILAALPEIEQPKYDITEHHQRQWDAMAIAFESKFDWLDDINDDGYNNLTSELKVITDLRRSTVMDLDDDNAGF